MLAVSSSVYYAWLVRPLSMRAKEDETLKWRIEEIHARSRETYGAPRVHAELAAQGVHVGRELVARLMRVAGLRGVIRRRWITTTERRRPAKLTQDLVERDFTASGPAELWVADSTYVPTREGFLYLAVVLDLWSRRVGRWAMAAHLRTELVLEALDMAVRQCCPVDVIHHSDHGSQ